MAEHEDVAGAGSEARRTFAAALRRGDAAAASSLYTDDAWLLAPAAAPIRGRGAIEQYWQAGVDAGVKRGAQARDDRNEGKLAYGSGATRSRSDAKAREADRGDYLLVHERQDDGSWRWAVEMFNPDVPSARLNEGSES